MSRMDRARCLAVLKRMNSSWFMLFLPPSWHMATVRAVDFLEEDAIAATYGPADDEGEGE